MNTLLIAVYTVTLLMAVCAAAYFAAEAFKYSGSLYFKKTKEPFIRAWTVGRKYYIYNLSRRIIKSGYKNWKFIFNIYLPVNKKALFVPMIIIGDKGIYIFSYENCCKEIELLNKKTFGTAVNLLLISNGKQLMHRKNGSTDIYKVNSGNAFKTCLYLFRNSGKNLNNSEIAAVYRKLVRFTDIHYSKQYYRVQKIEEKIRHLDEIIAEENK